MELLGNKWPIDVEVIEDRENGAQKVFFTKAKPVFSKPDMTREYQIKGIKKTFPAPKFRHLVSTSKGEFMRLYTPTPDEYYIAEFKKDDQKIEPVYQEDMKAWFSHQVKKSHEDWTKKSFSDKWLGFIMLMVVAFIFVAGVKFNSDGLAEQAQHLQGISESMQATQETQLKLATKWDEVVQRIDALLTKDGVPQSNGGQTVIVKPPA